MLERHVLFIMELIILKHFRFSFVAFFAYFWVFGPFTIEKNVLSLQKMSLPIRQVKTKMYLPESPFFKNSLAGASGLVLMSVPEIIY